MPLLPDEIALLGYSSGRKRIYEPTQEGQVEALNEYSLPLSILAHPRLRGTTSVITGSYILVFQISNSLITVVAAI